jgi:hypothetical protein
MSQNFGLVKHFYNFVVLYINEIINNMEIKEIKEHLEKLSIEELNDIESFIEDTKESKKLGNIPVGETFEFFDGEEYIVENRQPGCDCDCCAFSDKSYKRTCRYLCCNSKYRNDKQSVIFVRKINI